MKTVMITEKDLGGFIGALMQHQPVWGPIAKRSQFVFAELESPKDLRLDYDVTILPPKKLFFPPAQDLVCFDGKNYSACLEPKNKILFGVHGYDVKAIDQTDLLFSERNYDVNYMAHRQATTIVASSIQKVSRRAFFGSVGKDVQPKGHDAFLTKINGGYVWESLTVKGEALLDFGKFEKASEAQIAEAKKVNEQVQTQCQETLQHNTNDIATKVRAAFKNEELWQGFAQDCFSCGSCNTVCPTCYCFDVQDTWNVNQTSGVRTRFWDSCLTEDFSKVSLGAGATENFREERFERFRHRIMRKATYLNQKLGGPACVGCGRCSMSCTTDIADPVRVINKIMEM